MKTLAMKPLLTKTLPIAMGLLILVANGAVLAQGSGSGGGSKSGASSQAPVGHRQVRPSDLPKAEQAEDSSMSSASKEDRELDRKIKSICRGC
ncbi:conserved hypothetical protein; putative signal peptide [Bradyrhizobium sp. ORS 278]|uniref:hypothetical protein n=1 Tax=Bradyrhizobium sp. (strain ORS 278) TaxID=114615 RepID=UPI0001508D58|nr:hypothetical protein [Bradyrhizobium sp. ORS 278]CAL77368.1 conserved hypothetical protein; putative signal peptide [Bradyrhizobium sp. ORS 278]